MSEQIRKALLLAESMILAEFGDVPAVIAAALKEPTKSSLERFNELMADDKETPIERLRFFCSLAMNGQDWLDVEQFFDALATQPQAPQGAVTEWVDVSKSLPEKDVWVLVYEDDNDNPQDRILGHMLKTFRQRVTPAKLLSIDSEGYADWYLCYVGGSHLSITRNVTHWKPLDAAPTPETPKGQL